MRGDEKDRLHPSGKVPGEPGSALVFSLDPSANDTSVTLDLLRFCAAQAVCVGHSISFFGVADRLRPPMAPNMQNVGVLMFFVLSGFLIAHVLTRGIGQRSYGLAQFVIDRFARIYSAFLPALLV